jgi:AcrR family transcriptional regulator
MRPNQDYPRQSFIAAARRDQITKASIDVLASDGFAGTSLAAVADRLGVSKGVLSYHFPAKAEMLQAVVAFVLADAEAWMTPRIGAAPSYRAALHAYITANLSYLDTHRTEIFALTEVLANARAIAGIPEIFVASQQGAIAGLIALFDGGAAAGEFGDVPSGILAAALRATIDSVSERIRANPHFDLGPFERDLTRMFDRATSKEATVYEGAGR